MFQTQPCLAVSTLEPQSLRAFGSFPPCPFPWNDVLGVEGALVHSAAVWGHLWDLPCFEQCQRACHAKKGSTLGISSGIPSTMGADSGVAKKHPSHSGKGRDSWNPKKQPAHLSCVWHSVWEAGGCFVWNLILNEMSPRKHGFPLYNKMKLLNTFPSLSLPSLTLLFAWLTPTAWWLPSPPRWCVWQSFWVSLGSS